VRAFDEGHMNKISGFDGVEDLSHGITDYDSIQ